MEHKYFVVAIGRKGGVPPGGDEGMGRLESDNGPWSKGCKVLQGTFQPVGLLLMEFPTEKEATDWVNDKAQDRFREEYGGIGIARVVA
jgi:hypothetical protein